MRSNNRKKLPEFPVPEILVNQRTTSALANIVKNADNEAIRDNIYKGKYKDPSSGEDRYLVRERLRDIYHNKCAYCEDIDAKPEVEHYRPKKKYYWLCYEWTNLLPSCHYCNTESGKRDQFPIRGVRVDAPPRLPNGNWNQEANDASVSPLIDEQPFLLHPEIDQPDDGTFFKFYGNGDLEGTDPEGRGEKTIEICYLKRQNLLLRRQKLVIDPIRDSIHYVLNLQFEGVFKNEAGFKRALEMVFEKMVEMQRPDQPFSLLAIYIFEHFNEIIVPELPTPAQRTAVSAAFANFRKRLKYNQNIKDLFM